MLKNAKGLAIITVLKAGFLFSGRAGSGVIVARLPDGSWSPPSAISTAGAGVGGQIGAELTDFVFILNSKSAVDSFAQLGSVTLGTNVSVAAGPLGRNAEAAGTASLKAASAIFAYSKTKGLFAGISLEGSAIIERREANRKFYGNNCKARSILAGQVDAPPECDQLMRVLESRAFNNRSADEDDFYNDLYYDDIPDDFSDSGLDRTGNRRRTGSFLSSRRRNSDDAFSDDYRLDDDYDDEHRRPRRSSKSTRPLTTSTSKKGGWEDDVYDSRDELSGRLGNTRISQQTGTYSSPTRPPSLTKPNFGADSKVHATQAIALYTFKGQQNGDLPFKKGDVIDILQKSETADDWWTGRVGGSSGIFPANYVELI